MTMRKVDIVEIDKLSPSEKILLVEDIWDKITAVSWGTSDYKFHNNGFRFLSHNYSASYATLCRFCAISTARIV
jgi:hypothetical protein